ncbi:MAG: MarR family transcriptional regulator [Candidatus Dormibacteraeota bacterium]|nr:MarR family transcriptional regulator [Candidatus Dormibacteraeota bacterium]MBO0762372.1 MarR family transcriptional regulator [Candidatus Dormibacteraeota bacterium]
MERTPGTMVLLTRIARAVYRHANEAQMGMRLKEYASLSYLRHSRGVPQHALAEALHMDANNCVLVLNELESAGFAERRRDPNDRRRHIVEMTPAGEQALEQAERALETVEDEVLGALTPEERATLRDLLHRALEGEEQPAVRP